MCASVFAFFRIFDSVLYTLARQNSNKFGFALDLSLYLTASYILTLGKTQIEFGFALDLSVYLSEDILLCDFLEQALP